MQQSVFVYASGLFRIIGFLALVVSPILILHTILRIFRFVIRQARGERFSDLMEDTTDSYDRTRASGYAAGDGRSGYRQRRDDQYTGMRGGRGYSGKQTRY